MVISFDTQLVSQVNFHLPRLGNERDAAHFDETPRVELLDGDAMPIPVKLDVMTITSTAKTVDYELEIERYNKAAKHASLPQFATMMADDSSLLSGVSELDRVPPQSQALTEQRLKYWFQQADAQTRSNFLQWAEKQPPHDIYVHVRIFFVFLLQRQVLPVLCSKVNLGAVLWN